MPRSMGVNFGLPRSVVRFVRLARVPPPPSLFVPLSAGSSLTSYSFLLEPNPCSHCPSCGHRPFLSGDCHRRYSAVCIYAAVREQEKHSDGPATQESWRQCKEKTRAVRSCPLERPKRVKSGSGRSKRGKSHPSFRWALPISPATAVPTAAKTA